MWHTCFARRWSWTSQHTSSFELVTPPNFMQWISIFHTWYDDRSSVNDLQSSISLIGATCAISNMKSCAHACPRSKCFQRCTMDTPFPNITHTALSSTWQPCKLGIWHKLIVGSCCVWAAYFVVVSMSTKTWSLHERRRESPWAPGSSRLGLVVTTSNRYRVGTSKKIGGS